MALTLVRYAAVTTVTCTSKNIDQCKKSNSATWSAYLKSKVVVSYCRKGSSTGLTKAFLWWLYQTYRQNARSEDSPQVDPSSNQTLVNTKAPPPRCSKSRWARSQDNVFAEALLIDLFHPNSRTGVNRRNPSAAISNAPSHQQALRRTPSRRWFCARVSNADADCASESRNQQQNSEKGRKPSQTA